MANPFGTTSGIIDWNLIIESIVPKTGDHNNVTSVVNRSDKEATDNQQLLNSYRGIIDTWKQANYNLKNIEWWDYYPGKHFDISIQEKFADLVNADPKRVFVSELFPGHNVPYHWDVEDKEQEWLAAGDRLVRYVCFIDKPKFGHVLILEDECFYNIDQHSIYEWSSYRSHHAGTNCGSTPYYLFHFLGAAR
jgi:hypothetical protein